MILLSLIPFTAFVAVSVICLKAKHRYSTTLAKVSEETEALRLEKLTADSNNDSQFVTSIFDDKAPLGDLVSKYRKQRIAIIPGARRSDPAAWIDEDLLGHCRNWCSGLLSDAKRKAVYTTSFSLLTVLVINVTLAGWRYSTLSQGGSAPIATTVGLPDDDPFASTSSK